MPWALHTPEPGSAPHAQMDSLTPRTDCGKSAQLWQPGLQTSSPPESRESSGAPGHQPVPVCQPEVGTQPVPKGPGRKGAQGWAEKQGTGTVTVAVPRRPGSSRLESGGGGRPVPKVTASEWPSGSWSRASLGVRGWTAASPITVTVTVTEAVLSWPAPCPLPGTACSERGCFCPPVAKAGALQS